MTNYNRALSAIVLLFYSVNVFAGRTITRAENTESSSKIKDWVVKEIHRLSQKKLTQIGNINFGDLNFEEEKIKLKNITVFSGYFTDSSANEKLVCIKTTKKQSETGKALTLLIRCNGSSEDCYTVQMGKPTCVFKEKDLIDFDGDGYLDVFHQGKVLEKRIEETHSVEVFSFKKQQTLYSSFAKDQWTRASPMQKVLFIKGDVLYETLLVTVEEEDGEYKIKEKRTSYICGGGESVGQIKRKIKKRETIKVTRFSKKQTMNTFSSTKKHL